MQPLFSRRLITQNGIVFGFLSQCEHAKASPPISSERDGRPLVYRIEAGDPAVMQPFEGRAVQDIMRTLAKSDVVLVGSSREDRDDFEYAVELARQLAALARKAKRGVVLGLDAAPYGEEVSQSRAASWPAVSDASVLEPALSIDRDDAIGLGVSGDALRKVQRAGLAALDERERQSYVDDAAQFANYTKTPGFELFVKRCISRRFKERYGGDDDASAAGYLATSLLQDQAVATIADRQLRRSQDDTLLIALVDSDRVQFKLGSQMRLEQLGRTVRSVLVNPTAKSTYSATSRLRLSLSQEVASLETKLTTLADFVFFSRSPPPSLLSHMLNPIDGAVKIDFGLSTGGGAA